MSLDDGILYNDKLMRLARGDELPNPSIPVEYMMYDIWKSMRDHDKELANEVLEPAFVFMRAQVDKQRLKPMDLQTYFEYREQDVGKAWVFPTLHLSLPASVHPQYIPSLTQIHPSSFLSAIMRFSMSLHLTTTEQALALPLEANASKNISVVNDICSYAKEIRVAAAGHEGGTLCSSVPIVQTITGVDVDSAKRILWSMCREWEVRHRQLVDEIRIKGELSPALEAYLKGLEYQMGGNEVWSLGTTRYNDDGLGEEK